MQRWIVVGAGSAGCVAAARLSEAPDRHVTLLEAGPPLVSGAVPSGLDAANCFAALGEPGRTYADLQATRVSGGAPQLYLRGRGVGGSSAVNAMVAKHIDPGLPVSWGWADWADAEQRSQIPVASVDDAELGPVDRALLDASPDARSAALTRSAGRRITSAEAYLWPLTGRTNLDVRPDTGVERILLDGTRATGVLLDDGSTVSADRVVIAAGAIHSPALLLRSGVNAPGLGAHLQDHPSVALTLQYRSGIDVDTAGLALGSLAETRIGTNLIQLLPMNHLGAAPAGFGLLMVALMTPTSHAGTVTIDTAGHPVVDFALLDDERDLDALVAGVRHALDVLTHRAFTDVVEQVFIDDIGTTVDALRDDAAIATWARSNIADYVHATGTCGMGRTVGVDGDVVGYDNLYVCDASVFPSIPDVNTHLPTTALAEMLCARGMMSR